MKVRYIGDEYKVTLSTGATYDVLQIEGGWYRIYSDSIGDTYLFRPDAFQLVEAEPRPPEYNADDPRIAIY